jgi:hypothetical protein
MHVCDRLLSCATAHPHGLGVSVRSSFYDMAFEVFLRSVLRLLVTANVHSSSILVTLMMEAILPSETSILIRVKRSNILEDGILHYRRGNS